MTRWLYDDSPVYRLTTKQNPFRKPRRPWWQRIFARKGLV